MVTPSTMQSMEQGGRLSRSVVALGVVVALAVTAAKSRMKSWRRAFILAAVRFEDDRGIHGLQTDRYEYSRLIGREMESDASLDCGLRG